MSLHNVHSQTIVVCNQTVLSGSCYSSFILTRSITNKEFFLPSLREESESFTVEGISFVQTSSKP